MTDTTPAPSPAPAAADDDLAPFVVEVRANGATQRRLVNGRRATQVRDHLLADGTVVIRKATAREAMDLAVAGIKPETAAAGGEGGAA